MLVSPPLPPRAPWPVGITARPAREAVLDSPRDLDRFLAGVERRAFRLAQIALRDADDALDVVQDAMMQLASRYAARPPAEWRPLFYRILNNRIHDFQRRRRVRNRVLAWLPGRREELPDGIDPLDNLPDAGPLPLEELQQKHDQKTEAIEHALGLALVGFGKLAGMLVLEGRRTDDDRELYELEVEDLGRMSEIERIKLVSVVSSVACVARARAVARSARMAGVEIAIEGAKNVVALKAAK